MTTNPLPRIDGLLFTEAYNLKIEKVGSGKFGNCAVCGRRISKPNPLQVQTQDGCVVVDPDWVDDGSGSGWFSLGPECARKSALKPYARRFDWFESAIEAVA